MSIKAIIFDFDGLILDTESTELIAWQELYREYGCELPMDLWIDCIGRPHGHFDPYATLMERIGRELDRADLKQRRRKRTRELLQSQEPLPGVRQYLADARKLGLKTAIASSSTTEWVSGHLQRLGLEDQFACLTCAEHTRTHKPDPEPYLCAMKALGVNAQEAFALEDSPNGVRSAKSAGLFCVAAPNPVTGRLDLSAADLITPSLAALPLPDLIKTIERLQRERI